jgi:hypothetical protein
MTSSGGGSQLGVGGETAMGKEAWAGFFLLIGRGEREGVVSVPHISDSRPMAFWSSRNAVQHRSPVPGQTRTWHSRFEADLGHCSTGSGPNH